MWSRRPCCDIEISTAGNAARYVGTLKNISKNQFKSRLTDVAPPRKDSHAELLKCSLIGHEFGPDEMNIIKNWLQKRKDLKRSRLLRCALEGHDWRLTNGALGELGKKCDRCKAVGGI